jgi:hypothetical protein
VENKSGFKPASKQERSLYLLIGESVCAIQHVEDALSHSLTLKMERPRLKSAAEQILEKNHAYTLGAAIKVAKQSNLYHDSILRGLGELLSERNWLIHRSIAQGRDKWDLNIDREKLMKRIKNITVQSQRSMEEIEMDLIEFSEKNGVDMSRVRAEIKRQVDEG